MKINWFFALYIIGVVSIIIQLSSCTKDLKPEFVDQDNNQVNLTPYPISLPQNFPPFVIPKNNPLTEEGVLLGRMLYYDKTLHKNGNSACADCHIQKNAFTSSLLPGVMAHINLAWNTSFLWNGAVEGTLEDAMLFEVEEFFQSKLERIKPKKEYQILFKKVFGNNQMTTKQAAYAMAQFARVVLSANSKYDLVLRNRASFSLSEQRGNDIFFSERGDCFHCHAYPLFKDNSFHNIGLDSANTGISQGRAAVTMKDYDIGKFATGTLRNIALTLPYMHDGRFTTLEEVVEHYNSGVKHSETLDPIMTKAGKENGLGLSTQDKADLVAFLKTLTDTTFVNNPKFSNP
jgi:cytochrome c peroxidase